jgi:hypothetical protein
VSLQGRLAHFGAPGARRGAVESGVLGPPAHRGWCLVQAPRWGATRAGGAVWGSQIGQSLSTWGRGRRGRGGTVSLGCERPLPRGGGRWRGRRVGVGGWGCAVHGGRWYLLAWVVYQVVAMTVGAVGCRWAVVVGCGMCTAHCALPAASHACCVHRVMCGGAPMAHRRTQRTPHHVP